MRHDGRARVRPRAGPRRLPLPVRGCGASQATGRVRDGDRGVRAAGLRRVRRLRARAHRQEGAHGGGATERPRGAHGDRGAVGAMRAPQPSRGAHQGGARERPGAD